MDGGGVRAYAVDPDAAARLWEPPAAATGSHPDHSMNDRVARRASAGRATPGVPVCRCAGQRRRYDSTYPAAGVPTPVTSS